VVLSGVLCGIGVIAAMIVYLKVTGKKIIDRSILTTEELQYERNYSLLKAFSPWILLIVMILIINIPKDLFNQFYRVCCSP
jgi:lactate permease